MSKLNYLVVATCSHHGDGVLLSAAQNGALAHHRRFGDMAPVKAVIKFDIGNIVACVRALQRANRFN